jgi:hypothetical protein
VFLCPVTAAFRTDTAQQHGFTAEWAVHDMSVLLLVPVYRDFLAAVRAFFGDEILFTIESHFFSSFLDLFVEVH